VQKNRTQAISSHFKDVGAESHQWSQPLRSEPSFAVLILLNKKGTFYLLPGLVSTCTMCKTSHL